MPSPARIPDAILDDIRKAVGFLSSEPGVQRIWLYGSAGKGRKLDARSDLDFAVEGLPTDRIFSAWSELDAKLNLPLDLVRWEDASPLLRSEIEKGIVLREA